MHWRKLRAGELDHELIWLGVSVASLALTWLWLRLGLPLLRCPFHEITGCACPTCGVTRGLRCALNGDFSAAFGFNPLACIALGAAVLFDAYAATVLALRLPRLRVESPSAALGKRVRAGVLATIAANWAWLLWRGV